MTSIERGYNIYQANCARCHGPNGEGGIGPTLNSQEKLFAHLNPDYIHSMLQVGGRFACGDPNSLMPVWANTGTPPGPLNYKQVEDVIAFIRAEQGPRVPRAGPGAVRARGQPEHRPGGDVRGLGRPELDAGARLHAVPGLLEGRVPDAGVAGASGPRPPRRAPSGSAPASEAPRLARAVGFARGLGVPGGLRLARGLRQPGASGSPDRHGHRRERQGHRVHGRRAHRPRRRAVPDQVRQPGRQRPAQHPDQGRQRRRRVQRRHVPGRRDPDLRRARARGRQLHRSCAPCTRT